ncbi:MAG: hypothetical protein HC888_19575 [Candidatus Competibacteraceae bacterium]|nr:hypothetical protein [Candidatus Competibacteraceae bacterium]
MNQPILDRDSVPIRADSPYTEGAAGAVAVDLLTGARVIPLNDGWLFVKGEPADFTPVQIPHDWLISDARNLYESGFGWHKRELAADFMESGHRLFIRFDGVYMYSSLFVNDRFVGERNPTRFSSRLTTERRADAGDPPPTPR